MLRRLLTIGLLGCLTTPALAEGGLLSVTLDDARLSQLTNGLRIMNDLNLVGTLYVATEGVEQATTQATEPRFMTWAGVNAFVQSGWEIGAHTHTHPHLNELTPAQVEDELSHSRDLIIQHTRVMPVSFASPFGDYNDVVVASVMQYYQSHALAWGGNEGRNTPDNFSAAALGRFDVSWDVSLTAARVCDMMQQAAEQQQWLVLAFHDIVDGEAGQYQTSVDSFADMMYCAERLQREGALRVVTVKEGVAQMRAAKEESNPKEM